MLSTFNWTSLGSLLTVSTTWEENLESANGMRGIKKTKAEMRCMDSSCYKSFDVKSSPISTEYLLCNSSTLIFCPSASMSLPAAPYPTWHGRHQVELVGSPRLWLKSANPPWIRLSLSHAMAALKTMKKRTPTTMSVSETQNEGHSSWKGNIFPRTSSMYCLFASLLSWCNQKSSDPQLRLALVEMQRGCNIEIVFLKVISILRKTLKKLLWLLGWTKQPDVRSIRRTSNFAC